MSRPGLAANGPQREVFVNSATAGGYSSHGGCYQQAERAPVLPRGFFFGVTWGTGAPPPQGKVRAKCTHTCGPVAQGKVGGRENDCDSEVLAGLAT